MGNYKFRLSDMMPNAWFYKLKDMSKTSRNNKPSPSINKKLPIPTASSSSSQNLQHFQQRHSFYFSRPPIFNSSSRNPNFSETHSPNLTPKRSRRRSNRSSSSHVVTETSLEPHLRLESSLSEFGKPASRSSSCSCRVSSSSADIVIDVKERSFTKFEKMDSFDPISELNLPPILTKPAKLNNSSRASLSIKIVKEEKTSSRTKRETKPSNPVARGVKLRVNSPRIASKKIQQACARRSVSSNTRRRNLSEGIVIVKPSFDPQRDFKESMAEMIAQNHIRASRDLEELLACYLSLNSDDYHEFIVKAFEQIWLDMTDLAI